MADRIFQSPLDDDPAHAAGKAGAAPRQGIVRCVQTRSLHLERPAIRHRPQGAAFAASAFWNASAIGTRGEI
jgi:hypothetical protein